MYRINYDLVSVGINISTAIPLSYEVLINDDDCTGRVFQFNFNPIF